MLFLLLIVKPSNPYVRRESGREGKEHKKIKLTAVSAHAIDIIT